jgi:four helix bundle protein
VDSVQLRKRTRQFAVRIIKLAASLPPNRFGDVLGRQILKSGTSVGANYREALRASSRRHFISTLEISVREADETLYWLDLLGESGLVKPKLLANLMDEANQLIAILTATIRTAKERLSSQTNVAKAAFSATNPKS